MRDCGAPAGLDEGSKPVTSPDRNLDRHCTIPEAVDVVELSRRDAERASACFRQATARHVPVARRSGRVDGLTRRR